MNRKARISLIPILVSMLFATLITAGFGYVYSESAEQYNRTSDTETLDKITDTRENTTERINETREQITNIDSNTNLFGQVIDIASLIASGAYTALLSLTDSFQSMFTIINVSATSLPLGVFSSDVVSFLTTVAVLVLVAVLFRVAIKRSV